ncbi:PilN domain-containing protein [Kineococcus rhizosphaerae]|uniref:Tfp pilus assembly protein PilN n=1 Tax=Kineococcus rhizosphaerae TaxID=559628 RepID=A0A2T0R9R4_9ACTN|nr:hypothetical protein [Kineococcus rhizosphaerae]PRY17912.1 hypothetical protein CLV37_101154 [Kineococcus rhizosphaerae]
MSFQTLEAVTARTRVVRVNLLPTGFDDHRKDRNLRIGLGAVLLVVAGAVGGCYHITLSQVADAQTRLDAAQARTVELQRAQEAYSEVPRVLAQVKAAQQVRDQVSATEVPYYAYLDRLAAAAPTDLTMSTVTFAAAGSKLAGATDPSATATDSVGTLTVSGETLSMDTVAAWVDNVSTIHGFSGASVSDAHRDDRGVVTFTATVTLTSDALSAHQ